MKLVTTSTDTNYLYTLKGLLEANGIPATIQGENIARMFSPFISTQPGLWVYLDEQHQDALNLVNDNEYSVQNKIDVQEFYEINHNIISDPAQMNKTYIKLGLTVAGWLLAAFVLLKVLEWLTR